MHDDKAGKWEFKISKGGRIPPRIGPGGDRDPIYEPMKAEAYRACCEFYDKTKLFLNGGSEKPSIEAVIKAVVPHGSVLDAKLDDAEGDPLGPKVLVKFEDLDRPPERDSRSPRWLDPSHFPVDMMLTYPGGSWRFDDKRRKKDGEGQLIEPSRRRLIVSFGRGTNGNISLLRINANARRGEQIHRRNAKTDKDYHYDYRCDALEPRPDDAERANGHPSGTSKRGRADAIRLAGEHFDRAVAKGEKLVDPSLSRAEYEALLWEMFRVADELHEAEKAARKAERAHQ